MVVGAAIVLVIQFFFCLIPYYRYEGVATLSIFKDQPAIMILSFVILALAIISIYKQKIATFVAGSIVLYSAYFIVAPINVMVEMKMANFSSIACILLSLVAAGLALADIIKSDD